MTLQDAATDNRACGSMPYARVGDDTVWIAGVRRGEKAAYRCPTCHHPVHARKGPTRPHTFAHNPGAPSSCTRLSTNAKRHGTVINATALRLNAGGLALDVFCGRHGLTAHPLGTLRVHPNSIRVERARGQLRPDIQCTTLGQQDVALEVSLHHPLDQHRIESLKAQDLAIIEMFVPDIEDRMGEVGESCLRTYIETAPSLPVRLCVGPEHWNGCPLCQSERLSSEGAHASGLRALPTDADHQVIGFKRTLTIVLNTGQRCNADMLATVVGSDPTDAELQIQFGPDLEVVARTPVHLWVANPDNHRLEFQASMRSHLGRHTSQAIVDHHVWTEWEPAADHQAFLQCLQPHVS